MTDNTTKNGPSIGRRHFLTLGGGLLSGLMLGQDPAWAIGPRTRIKLAQLKYNGSWNPRPNARSRLAQEIKFRTSVPVDYKPVVLSLSDPKLFYHPLLVMSGDKGFSMFSDKELLILKKYLELGGFLWVDASELGTADRGFDASFRKLCKKLFPGRKLEKLPNDHVVFRAFYRVTSPAGRVLVKRSLEGIRLDRRLCILYTPNDVLGALEQVALGNWKYDVTGGPAQRRMALRLAVNVVEYALCLNYKSDQVHLDYLLRKRKWFIRRSRRP